MLLVLILCVFSISRELDNLTTAFEIAKKEDQAEAFYRLLAMKQVFTIPHSLRRPKKKVLRIVPRIMFLLPPLTHGAIWIHDWETSSLGRQLSDKHTLTVLSAEAALFVLILGCSGLAWHRQRQLDSQWEDRWKELQPPKTA